MSSLYDELRSLNSDLDYPHLLIDLEFTNYLLITYEDQGHYGTDKHYAYLRKVADDLVYGFLDTISGLVHVDNNHYIAFVLEAETRTVHTGDPMRPTASQKVCDTLGWWFKTTLTQCYDGQSGDSDISNINIEHAPLPISQQVDLHSCGVLSLNALRHYYTQGWMELVQVSERGAVAEERMRLAYRTLTIHSQYVRQL